MVIAEDDDFILGSYNVVCYCHWTESSHAFECFRILWTSKLCYSYHELKHIWWLLSRRTWEHLMTSTGTQLYTAYSHLCRVMRLERDIRRSLSLSLPAAAITHSQQRLPNLLLKTANNEGSAASFSSPNKCLTHYWLFLPTSSSMLSVESLILQKNVL